jgi:single-strand DNA-binding protein
MVSYNKVILIGNLTKDPEIRYTPSGTPVANFRLAVNHKYKQGDDLKEEVCYIDIVVFGKQAENCGQFLNKGQSVIVDGRLQERRWETEDGQKRNKHELVAQTVRFMPKRGDTAVSAGKTEPVSEDVDPSPGSSEADVPF